MLQQASDESVLERLLPTTRRGERALTTQRIAILALPYARHPHSEWRRPEMMRRPRKTGNEAIPGRARVCEVVGKDNICEYTVTYNYDLVRGKHRIN